MPNFHGAYSENDTLMERPNNPGGVVWETPEEFYIGSPELPPQRGGYSGSWPNNLLHSGGVPPKSH